MALKGTDEERENEKNVKAITTVNEHGMLQVSIQDEKELSKCPVLASVSSDYSHQDVLEATIKPPRMNICILVVGTQGDVQPFIGVGKRLIQDGHRVRLATHSIYRNLVTSHGLEFYPLGGDPKELAAYMVKTGGQLLPTGYDAVTKDIPRNMLIIEEILLSTWPAVSQPDPDALGQNIPGEPFTAHAIISNPVTYGHIHVAEKLGVPLHIAFPQPWVPTKYFPHPLSMLPYNGQISLRNFVSYKAVDAFMWAGVESMVNRFREEVLNLRKIRKGDKGRNILLDLDIPHSFMWSSTLVPKPPDWGPRYDIVGTVLMDDINTPIKPYDAAPELLKFLSHSPPVFIGFGSMVMPDATKLTKMIIQAAVETNTRVLLQSSWSNMGGELTFPENIFLLGPCPHDWLMPQMAAVVHHGGAGTTAAGLLAGKPTFICPFFGDQPFWGHAVYAAGVGVEPCPIADLTCTKLKNAFVKLQSQELKEAAEAISLKMQKEDGADELVKCFYKHLPLEKMVCDIDPTAVATRWSVDDNLKLSDVVEFVILTDPANRDKMIIPYHSIDYSARGPDSTLSGMGQGIGAFVHEVGGGVKDLVAKPVNGFKEHGAKGAAIGTIKGIGGLIIRPTHGMILWADKVAVGHHNKYRKEGESMKSSQFDEKIRISFAGGDKETYKRGSTIVEGKTRQMKNRDVVSICLSSDEKATLRASLDKVLVQKRKLQFKEQTPPPSPEKSTTHEKSLDETKSSKDIISVSSAYYKSDGTLKIGFRGCEQDELSESFIEEIKSHSEREKMKVRKVKNARAVASIPPLNICILVVGTRGDVQPFVALGIRLQQDGHRVRLATHTVYRKFVTDHGLEFYPLGGDPTILSEYIVKTQGHLVPTGYDKISKDLPKNMKMIEDILFSTWPAVSAPDTEGSGLVFRADAVISNPITYGHIHVAEKLGCPLHIVSPHPWVPTCAWPHPLANMLYDKKWRKSNYMSYKIVDMFMWQGTENMVNRFRQSLNLPKVNMGDSRHNLMTDLHIPHAITWSPSLVSKPYDWGFEVDITGTLNLKQKTKLYTPSDALLAFLEGGPAPVFIGFGSMVVEDPRKVTQIIVEAAIESKVRILLQSSWSDVSGDISIPENVLLLGSCPHDWLIPRMSAVIHHGGAYTTYTGLQAGKPTFICPFFGDQPFWGQAVVDAGVGVTPVPIQQLTVPVLVSALLELQSEPLQTRAKELAEVLNAEDGVGNTVAAFYAHLPIEVMLCDVDPTRLARIYDPTLKLKLSYEADMVLRSIPKHSKTETVKYKPLQYSRTGPRYFLEDFSSVEETFADEIGSTLMDIYSAPKRGFLEDGAKGMVKDVGQSLAGLVVRPLNRAALWADKVATGTANFWVEYEENKIESIANQKVTKLLKQKSKSALVVEEPKMGNDEEKRQYIEHLLETYRSKIAATTS